MRKTKASMARCAMVLLYMTVNTGLLAGCGAPVYEMQAVSGPDVRENIRMDSAFSSGEETGSVLPEETAESAEENGEILVYVCGSVRKSGVYTLPYGARVYEAVEAAGGMTESADETALNQADLLSDGQQITVPEKRAPGEPVQETAGGNPPEPEKGNINTADESELTTLKGIGASRAADIVAYRKEHGPFETIEDIMQVSGIKSSVFGRIQDSITVG